MTIVYLSIALIVAALALVLVVDEMRCTRREKLRLQLENIQLHKTNNSLSWDNSMLLMERKCVSMEYGIKMLPWRAPAEVARRTNHAH